MAGIIRVVIGGRLIGAQRWSIGHTLDFGAAGTSPGGLNTYAEALFTGFKARVWTGSSDSKLAAANVQGTTVDSLRAYLKPDSSSPAIQIGTSVGAAAVGLITTLGIPPQCSIAATLEDGQAGRHHKGRMYLPCTATTVAAASLTIPTSQATGLATSIADYLSFVRTVVLDGTEPCIPIVSSLTADTPITAVSVDTVVDTQRRRRDKVTGTRQRVALVVG